MATSGTVRASGRGRGEATYPGAAYVAVTARNWTNLQPIVSIVQETSALTFVLGHPTTQGFYCSRATVSGLVPSISAHEGMNREADSHTGLFLNKLDTYALGPIVEQVLAEQAVTIQLSLMNRAVALGIVILAAMLLTMGRADAQVSERPTETTSASRRARCTAARQRLDAKARVAASDTVTINTIRTLSQCRESAGASLPRLWQGDVTEPAALRALMEASSDVRDARIFATVSGVARDGSRPRLMRQAALVVLASYVDQRITGRFHTSTSPGGEPSIQTAYVVDRAQQEGSNALAANVRSQVEGILRQVRSDKRGALEDLAYLLLVEIAAISGK